MSGQRKYDDAIRDWLGGMPERAPDRAVQETIQRLRDTAQPRMVVLRLPLPLAAAIVGLAVLLGALGVVAGLGRLEPGRASPSPSGSSGACSLELAVGGRSPIIVGRGFAADSDVVLEIDRADGTHISIDVIERPELHTDAQGRFGMSMTPFPADLGRGLITAVAGGCTASVATIVTADDLPAPCPDPGLTRTDLRDSPTYRAAVDLDQPVHWWHFDESSGPLAADSAGDADGQWVGQLSPVSGGVDSGALYFNGDGAFVELSELTLPGAFTVEAWIQMCDVVDNSDALVGHSFDPPNINFHTEHMRLFTDQDDTVIANTAVASGVWEHWAIARDTSGTFIFRNGTLDGSGDAWAGPMVIDAIGRGSAGYLQGMIDELAIYDRALHPEQLAAHAHAP